MEVVGVVRGGARETDGAVTTDPIKRFISTQKILKSHIKLLSDMTGSAFE